MEENVENLKPIEKQGLDLTEFEGVRVKIEKVNVEHVKSKFNTDGLVPVLKVQTEPITEILMPDSNDKIVVRASELFNLAINENSLGWSTAPKGKLNNFLAKMKCTKPQELVGKLVTVRARIVKTESGEKTFLGFITN